MTAGDYVTVFGGAAILTVIVVAVVVLWRFYRLERFADLWHAGYMQAREDAARGTMTPNPYIRPAEYPEDLHQPRVTFEDIKAGVEPFLFCGATSTPLVYGKPADPADTKRLRCALEAHEGNDHVTIDGTHFRSNE